MFLRWARLCLAFVVILVPAASANAQKVSSQKSRPHAQSQVIDRKFESKSLARVVSYRMFVPSDYEHSTRRYPVLYLLHGLYGSFDSWESRTNLVHYAEKYHFLIA